MDEDIQGRSLAVLVVMTRTGSTKDLTSLLRVEPDDSWQKGSRRGRGETNVHTYSGIEIRSHIDRPTHRRLILRTSSIVCNRTRAP
jgi:hypothetical protein